MKITIKKQLEAANMPISWQIFSMLHFIVIVLVSLFANDFWINILRPILGLPIVIGVTTGIWKQQPRQKIWYLLLTSVTIFEMSIILHSLIYFELSLNPVLPFWIKQVAIIIAAIFSIQAMFFLEEKYKLKGITIDLSLTVLSIFCFMLIVNTEYLNIFLFELDFIRQISLLNILASALFVLIAVAHIILSKTYNFKSAVVLTIISLTTIHFILEFKILFPDNEKQALMSQISWSLFLIVSNLTMFYGFLEKFNSNYISHEASELSRLFMWPSSILAILVIPLAIILNWILQEKSSLNLLAGLSSFILGAIVIWRFIILIRHSNKQRKQLRSIAHKDELTEVYNYLGYHEKYLRSSITNSLVITMDIDDFKSINDLYGRPFGDEVLKSLAKRLMKLEGVKLVARIGPDNFIAVFQTPKNKILTQLKSLEKALGVWDIVQERRIAVPLTFGASHSDKITDIELLTREAEKALNMARTKRISFSLYTDKDSDKVLPRHELRGILQQALDRNFLPVHFQPIYDLKDGSLKALELLIRIQSIQHGLLLPSQFLDQARSYGLLTPLTNVCVNMIAKHYDELPSVIININLPPYMLENPRILNEFLICFKDAKLSPTRFCIEVTEDEDIPAEHLLDSVKLLKKVGFNIAMDDFGTGYSSLARLSMLPFDIVKIDRSILLAASSGNKAILESTITLIKRLGLSVVVEGVETFEQLNLIKTLGADSVQGFLLSKPVDILKATNLPLNAANIISEF